MFFVFGKVSDVVPSCSSLQQVCEVVLNDAKPSLYKLVHVFDFWPLFLFLKKG